MKTSYYLAYGSNMNLAQMASRCPSGKLVGKGLLEDYRLIFKQYATIIQEEGCAVPYALWQIDDVCEEALDEYEDFPNLYRKEYLNVTLDGQEVVAMVYIMNEEQCQIQVPSKEYVQGVREGYEDIGFQQTYIDEALIFSKIQ